ncbi:D-alanyl-D-alanine carboxypeptidase family protein [Candidatus Endolissoclinum faulkneri L2]|uniref:serine-type D-Ala-D-Ala carboxypeptidase n=1 Tax=Candidatus Endolissoclinum faulkneri L2 TaxID=1193729 RepID=K7YRD8_9PROT|nr:D-alanyl-D-alanine carboxypeptidase family protein [Candidatus Endolissoclinum faulkneri]AFX99109.1 D-alanyl-D-alanine carboxypeptidase family protein [Candidatus Endolissoclinum faulkneri L2]
MIVSTTIRITYLLLFMGILLPSLANAAKIATSAREAILLDYDTGYVLLQKNADRLMPPASITKIMTVLLAFERLADGRLRMEDEIPISEQAWKKGGSKMFVEIGSRVSVHDILRGIIVQSGNDAAIALAEAIAGTETAFAELMNEKASRIGMGEATFYNATGWPDPKHLVTARGLAVLAIETIRKFPEYYKIYAEKSFIYNGIKQNNRNSLLYKNIGVDGLKTGYTEIAGYGLTASAKRNERRLILVVSGLKSANQRSRESERLLEWGFREFNNYKLFDSGQTVEQAEVWFGEQNTVSLTTEKELVITMDRISRKEMQVSVEYDSPILAPILKGQVLAQLRISIPNREDQIVPLVAKNNIDKLNGLNRISRAIYYLILGYYIEHS